MDVTIETFDNNKDWLKSLRKLNGEKAFSDEQINKMTEEEATQIATKIMEE